MTKEEAKEQNRQWAIRIAERRDIEKSALDRMDADSVAYEYQRGRWSALCDLLSGEFSKKLLKNI